jgi:G3E family GTPase
MSDPILVPGPRLEPIVSPTGEPVPVTLLTGFLGVGKTTLLNRILNGDHGLKVGVLVNDFGSINIDAELIEGITENTISLSNGCICCEIREDLVTSLEDLLDGNRDVEYVILEASGIADPETVVSTFSDPKYEELLRLDSVTCVIDAEAVFADGDNAALAVLKLRQIGYADLVIVNKVDLVPPEAIPVIHEWINRLLLEVRILDAVYCDVPLEVLLSVGRFDPEVLVRNGNTGTPEHDPGFETWEYTSAEPMSVDELRAAVRSLPASVYRCKGFVYDAERPEERVVLQSVARRTNITAHGSWSDRTRQTQLVIIGTDLDRAALQATFDACKA